MRGVRAPRGLSGARPTPNHHILEGDRARTEQQPREHEASERGHRRHQVHSDGGGEAARAHRAGRHGEGRDAATRHHGQRQRIGLRLVPAQGPAPASRHAHQDADDHEAPRRPHQPAARVGGERSEQGNLGKRRLREFAGRVRGAHPHGESLTRQPGQHPHDERGRIRQFADGEHDAAHAVDPKAGRRIGHRGAAHDHEHQGHHGGERECHGKGSGAAPDATKAPGGQLGHPGELGPMGAPDSGGCGRTGDQRGDGAGAHDQAATVRLPAKGNGTDDAHDGHIGDDRERPTGPGAGREPTGESHHGRRAEQREPEGQQRDGADARHGRHAVSHQEHRGGHGEGRAPRGPVTRRGAGVCGDDRHGEDADREVRAERGLEARKHSAHPAGVAREPVLEPGPGGPQRGGGRATHGSYGHPRANRIRASARACQRPRSHGVPGIVGFRAPSDSQGAWEPTS
nr:hypothetical protein [Demequina litorisediminis]